MKHVTAALPISFLSRTKSVRGGGGYSASLNRAVSRFVVCVTAMIAFTAASVYGQMPPPTAEILFPSKGQTGIARNFDIVIRVRGAIDTTKLNCKWKEADSTHDDLYRPSVLLIKKSIKDMLQPSGWNRFAASGKFKLINDSTLYLSTPFLDYNTTYTIVIDSLRKLAGGLYTRDTCNFTITSPPHAVTGFSLDASRSIRCLDTITINFNQPIDTLITPSGSIIQILRHDSTGVFNVPIAINAWLDSTHKKVFVRPYSLYQLGEPYIFKINTHFLNGDTSTSISAMFDVKKGFTIYTKPKILALPDSLSQHEKDSIADYLLSDYIEPPSGGKSFRISDTANIYAQRIVGQYRLVGFESSTDSVLFSSITTNTINIAQSCVTVHNVAFTAVYEIIPKQNFVFRDSSHCTMSVLYNDSVYTVTDSLQLEMYVDSMDRAAVWVIPDSGYTFNGWSSNVSPYNSLPPIGTATLWIDPAWTVGGWIQPNIGLIPNTGEFAFSADATVVQELNDDNAIDEVNWITTKRWVTDSAVLRTIIAGAPDCFEWVQGGDSISSDKKTIYSTKMTAKDPEAHSDFQMRRIRIALRVEQRIIVNENNEDSLYNKSNIAFDGSQITIKETGKEDNVITNNGIVVKWEDPSPGPKKKPYFVKSDLRCGKTSVVFNNDTIRRKDKIPWSHYQEVENYTVTTPTNKKLWDALSITEEKALFINAETGQKEIRVRELFLYKFQLLEVGLGLLQKDGSFETKYKSFKDVSASAIGFPLSGNDDAETGRGSMFYSSSGAQIKLVFNEKLDTSLTTNGWFIPITATTNSGIDGMGNGGVSYYVTAGGSSNFVYNGTYGDNGYLYTFKLNNYGYVAPKMAEVHFNLQGFGGRIRSETGAILEEGLDTYLTDMEMPEVKLTLEKIHYTHDGDGDPIFWDDYGQVYSYTNGGIVTVGTINSNIYNIDSAGNSIKMPAGDKTTDDVNDDPDYDSNGNLDDGDPGPDLICNRVFAHKAPRVRKTDVLYGFISSWEEDDRDFFKTIAKILDTVKHELGGIKNAVDSLGTNRTDTTNTSLKPNDVVQIIETGLGILSGIFKAFADPQQELMGEQHFYGSRSNFFGKYDKSQTEYKIKNVIYYWRVDLW